MGRVKLNRKIRRRPRIRCMKTYDYETRQSILSLLWNSGYEEEQIQSGGMWDYGSGSSGGVWYEEDGQYYAIWM